jgi:hypothetical protein
MELKIRTQQRKLNEYKIKLFKKINKIENLQQV